MNEQVEILLELVNAYRLTFEEENIFRRESAQIVQAVPELQQKFKQLIAVLGFYSSSSDKKLVEYLGSNTEIPELINLFKIYWRNSKDHEEKLLEELGVSDISAIVGGIEREIKRIKSMKNVLENRHKTVLFDDEEAEFKSSLVTNEAFDEYEKRGKMIRNDESRELNDIVGALKRIEDFDFRPNGC